MFINPRILHHVTSVQPDSFSCLDSRQTTSILYQDTRYTTAITEVTKKASPKLKASCLDLAPEDEPEADAEAEAEVDGEEGEDTTGCANPDAAGKLVAVAVMTLLSSTAVLSLSFT